MTAAGCRVCASALVAAVVRVPAADQEAGVPLQRKGASLVLHEDEGLPNRFARHVTVLVASEALVVRPRTLRRPGRIEEPHSELHAQNPKYGIVVNVETALGL